MLLNHIQKQMQIDWGIEADDRADEKKIEATVQDIEGAQTGTQIVRRKKE